MSLGIFVSLKTDEKFNSHDFIVAWDFKLNLFGD